MALVPSEWRPCTIHEVHAAFLMAERGRLDHPSFAEALSVALREPLDLEDPRANHLRARLLFAMRYNILCEVPADTAWFEMTLDESHLDQLRVIGSRDWVDEEGRDENELRSVASRNAPDGGFTFRTAPSTWSNPVLWGHDGDGPLTILEGNNRLLALAALGMPEGLKLKAFVGLSPSACFWHLPDHVARSVTGPLMPPQPQPQHNNEVSLALKFSRDCRAMAKQIFDTVVAGGIDRECASLTFLARATSAMESVEILVERGMNADATSVGRTITELDIDFAYILKDKIEERWRLYFGYEMVSDWHDAQAWNALHDGNADPALMEKALKKFEAVKADYPDEYRWAGKNTSLKKRAEEVDKLNNYRMAYSSGCKASHSGASGLRHIYDTKEDAAGNLTGIAFLVGSQLPDAHPLIIAGVSYLGVLASTINHCGLQANFDDAWAALEERLMRI